MEQIKGTYNMKAQFLHETLNNRVLNSPKQIWILYFFLESLLKKLLKYQISKFLS
jgi:hypothetical protein